MNAILYYIYFVIARLLFHLLVKSSSAALHVSDLLTSVCKHVKLIGSLYTSPTLLACDL